MICGNAWQSRRHHSRPTAGIILSFRHLLGSANIYFVLLFSKRSLAETHYQLGVAYTFTTEFREAVKSFESAAEVIKLRIENLK